MESDERLPMSTVEHSCHWFLRWHGGDLTLAERDAYVQWLKTSPVHISETLRAARLYSRLRSFRGQLFFTNEDEISSDDKVLPFSRRANAQSERASGTSNWSQKLIAATAVALFTIAALVVQQSWFARTIETQASEWRSMTLSDGTLVNLGPRTELRHRFSDEQRVIHLAQGEAMFEVAKDPARPFIVDAKLARVQATGTQFAVERRGGQVLVTVREGSVAVKSDTLRDAGGKATSIALTGGEQVAVSAAGAKPKTNVNVERELAWADRALDFGDGTTVVKAVDEFNRRNRLQIYVDPSLGSQQVRATFDAGDPESFAEIVAADQGALVVRESPDVLRVTRR
jgi:transmembrane sensor